MQKRYVKDRNNFYRKVIIEPLQRNNVKEISDEEKEVIKGREVKKKIQRQKRKNQINKSAGVDGKKGEYKQQLIQPDVTKNKIKHKNLYKKIGKIEPLYKGSTIFLIGGGPSLKDFNFKQLNGKVTIAINKAFLFYPNATALYWTDARFYQWYEKDINLFKGMKVTNKPKPVRHDIINLQDTGRDGLETRPTGVRHGNNSGYAAMNLAVHFGAKRIVLLGYDMKAQGKTTHWHDGYNSKQNERVYQNSMLPFFPGLVDPLEKLGIEVYNANIHSAIDLWPKIELQTAINL